MAPNQPQQFISRRSESDMLNMAPIKLRLGKRDFEVPILNNKKAAEWRDKLFEALSPLVAAVDFSGIDLSSSHSQVSQAMSAKLSQELIAYPQKLAQLLFDYAPSLPKEAIVDGEDAASDEQICLAFAQVAEVGYPFFFHLWATKRALAIPGQKPPERSTSTAVQ
jgi:hypothetical protein